MLVPPDSVPDPPDGRTRAPLLDAPWGPLRPRERIRLRHAERRVAWMNGKGARCVTAWMNGKGTQCVIAWMKHLFGLIDMECVTIFQEIGWLPAAGDVAFAVLSSPAIWPPSACSASAGGESGSSSSEGSTSLCAAAVRRDLLPLPVGAVALRHGGHKYTMGSGRRVRSIRCSGAGRRWHEGVAFTIGIGGNGADEPGRAGQTDPRESRKCVGILVCCLIPWEERPGPSPAPRADAPL
eukprot:gene138-biopygen7722